MLIPTFTQQLAYRKIHHLLLLRLRERGVTVEFWSKGKDIFQTSIDDYRDKEESLRRDWVDNLDLSLMEDLS